MSSSCRASAGGYRRTACRPSPARSSVTRTPVACSSWRAASPIAVTACLVHEYSEPGSTRRPATLEVSSRWPRFGDQRSDRGADRERRSVDVREDHLAPVLGGVLERSRALAAEAGVGEGHVERPKASSAAAPSAAAAPTRSRRSARRARARGRPAPAASSSRRSAERAASTTRQPSCTARRAVAAPIPEEAPVIRNTPRFEVAGSLIALRSSLVSRVAAAAGRHLADPLPCSRCAGLSRLLADAPRPRDESMSRPGAGGDGCRELPPRSARAPRRPRRRRRRARRRRGARLRRLAARPAELPAPRPLPRRPRRPRRRLAAPRRRRRDAASWRCRPAPDRGRPEEEGQLAGRSWELLAPGTSARAGPRRQRAARATSASPPPPARRRASPSAGCRARRAGCRCG